MEPLHHPIRIGRLDLGNRVLLAPLAGVSDVPFRRICQEMGAGLTCIEMLSSIAVSHQARRTVAMMTRHPAEPVLGVQMTGSDADDIGEAVAILSTGPYDVIDLNMGCPVRKIISKGWGSALLCDPARVSRIVHRARMATHLPVTVKIRIGFEAGRINVQENAARIAAAGADALTIHGRTRADSYGDRVDYGAIRIGATAAREAAPGPIQIVGNGDILDAAGAALMRESTGCDAVMISRGALGNPWIFREILGHHRHGPSLSDWKQVVFRHMDYHQQHHADPRIAAIRFRKHLLWYLHGFPGVKRLRDRCSVVGTLDEARKILDEFCDALPADTIRFEDQRRGPARRRPSEHDPTYQMDRTHDRDAGSEPCLEALT